MRGGRIVGRGDWGQAESAGDAQIEVAVFDWPGSFLGIETEVSAVFLFGCIVTALSGCAVGKSGAAGIIQSFAGSVLIFRFCHMPF